MSDVEHQGRDQHAVVREHDRKTFDEVDRTLGAAVVAGYAVGLLVIFGFMVLVMHYADPDLPWYTQVLVGVVVAFWIGIMGAVVAVGRWSMRHEKELFHREGAPERREIEPADDESAPADDGSAPADDESEVAQPESEVAVNESGVAQPESEVADGE
jgi:hypothetical protein